MALNQTSAVAKTTVSDAELTAALREAGVIQEGGTSNPRIKVSGSTFVVGDDVFVYNHKNEQPAFLARLVEPVEEYQGFWFDEQHAELAKRPEIANHMCKSYFKVPTQAKKFSETGYPCGECPFAPFLDSVTGKNCGWKGDLRLQVIPPSGQLTGDEPIYVLSLSITGMIEFVGTRKNPTGGSASAFNFMHKLARMGTESEADNPSLGLMKALTSYKNGGVVVAAKLLPMQNANGSNKWVVPSFDPVAIIDVPEAASIEAANSPAAEYDDLPF